jgi:hypothetical protein
MSFQHASLAAGRWFDFSLAEQLGNIGSEVSRAIRARKEPKQFEAAVSRAMELFNLTLSDPRWTGRLKEILLAHELFSKAVKEKIDDDTLDYLNRYFSHFACQARNPYNQAKELLDALFQFIDETFIAYICAQEGTTVWSSLIKDHEQRERRLLVEEGLEQLIDNQDQIISYDECKVQVKIHQIKNVLQNLDNIHAKNTLKIIYDDWESYYRIKFQDLLDKTIQSDIWGDLGYIRQSITHRRSLGIDKLKNAKIIKDFKPGEKIILTPEVMKNIYEALHNWYTDFLMEHFSPALKSSLKKNLS